MKIVFQKKEDKKFLKMGINMTFQIEDESNIDLGIDYKSVIERTIKKALEYEQCPYEAEVNVVLTVNDEIQQINREYRQIDAPTDVLSFPMIDYEAEADFSHVEDRAEEYFNMETGELLLGDIIISVEKVIEQAKLYGHSVTRELAFLVAHSMLHLMGYDHMEENERAVMENRQRKILAQLGISR